MVSGLAGITQSRIIARGLLVAEPPGVWYCSDLTRGSLLWHYAKGHAQKELSSYDLAMPLG